MHYTISKSILSPTGGLNIYRGCLHGCIYCDSRSKCYQMKHAFEDVEVKKNAIELLEEELKKRKPMMIGTGSMSDPYIPIERTLGYTRKMLELVLKYGFGVRIQTKSSLILRDIDLIDQINQKTKAVVEITLTTYDDNLCKILEPNVSLTSERIEILKECKKRNIPTIVWLDPILPFINDTKENILGILDYCIKYGVYGIICFNMGLTLREGNREYYYQKLDEHFPNLKYKYIKTYGYKYEVISQRNDELMSLFYQITKKYNIKTDINEIFSYGHEFPKKYQQLTIFDEF